MSENYKKLVLDPGCLKPANEVNNHYVYLDALEAVNNAMSHPHITVSEMEILAAMKLEIRKNRFDSD